MLLAMTLYGFTSQHKIGSFSFQVGKYFLPYFPSIKRGLRGVCLYPLFINTPLAPLFRGELKTTHPI
jgi:hypothetical protein